MKPGLLHLIVAILALAASLGTRANAAQAQNLIATSGNYRVELRVPADGLFSGEEVDIEFRLSNLAKEDPSLGPAGVPNAKISTIVWMPSMPGMPKAKPATHAEGVPGDYGIVAFFPHAGEYQIDLAVRPPGAAELNFSLKVDVGDERPSDKQADKPYYLDLVELPERIAAGSTSKLGLAVREMKTKKIVKDFDIVHEKRFHLIIVSKDLSYFLHEHPEQRPDGVWIFEWAFPMGGEYWVYADVAPAGKGAQILSAGLQVAGPDGEQIRLAATPTTVSSEGVTAKFAFADGAPAIGRMTQVRFEFTDTQGNPLTDLEPYLGAFGHLMIIHQDGRTFVHSHPAEDEEATVHAKRGALTFNARMPRAGVYKGWAQIQRGGRVVTIPFVFEARAGSV